LENESKVESSVDEDENKVCTVEDENMAIHIVLKKNYSDVKSKLRDLHILKDIEDALNVVSVTDEFKELVDSYGFLDGQEKIDG
jgi:hypothetical protein